MTLAAAFIIGAVAGSFLNVCIYRIPLEKSIVRPGSACPRCNHRLGLIDLIPILSYLRQKGRCRYCRGPISFQYPLVEILYGAVTVALVARFGWSPAMAAFWVFCGGLIVVAMIDLETMLIADGPILLAIFAVGALALWQGNFNMAAGGFAGGAVIIIILREIASAIYKVEAMGLGDVKLAAVIGMALGFPATITALLLSFIIGAAGGIVALATGRKKRTDPIPFGPALAAGGVIALLWGEPLIALMR
jgi:leader peptidase (prepilin peptidase)/N-methyltransferase